MKLILVVAFIILCSTACHAVLNGLPATQGQFPYLVYVVVDPGTPYTYACGGGIISSRYVISAGHCSFGGFFKVIVGRIDVDGFKQEDIIDVEAVIRPSDYGKDNIFNYDDVAVFTLKKDVFEKPNYIQYLDIGLNSPPVGAPLTLAGFGRLKDDKDTSLSHYNTVQVSSDSECVFKTYSNETSYCINDPKSGFCNGDSGSPLVVRNPVSDRWILVGLSSYGHAGVCGYRKPDAVISKIAVMIDFIKIHTYDSPPRFVEVQYSTETETTLIPLNGPASNCPSFFKSTVTIIMLLLVFIIQV
ncbi:serine protease [Acrasis kona]|uniref:Serine protease n=1 Tax=Acrasis kona TaxID=1008807 RepID=A0AAW2ZS58_9EUKA